MTNGVEEVQTKFRACVDLLCRGHVLAIAAFVGLILFALEISVLPLLKDLPELRFTSIKDVQEPCFNPEYPMQDRNSFAEKLGMNHVLGPPEDLGFDGFCPKRFHSRQCNAPPCEDPVNVFLVWRGRNFLPLMYEAGLISTMKIFGADYRVIIITDSLTEVKSWYPTIWRVSLGDFVDELSKIPSLSNRSDWNTFIEKLESSPHIGAHTADFLRIAVLFLCGGVYSDFDSLWLKQPPADYMQGGFAVGKRQHETLSNGVMGFPKGNSILLRVLEQVLAKYNPNSWESIGGPLLYARFKECNAMDCRLAGFFSHWHMYTLFPGQASRYFHNPTSADDAFLRRIKNRQTLQLHMYGEITKVAEGTRPQNGSLYDIVCKEYGYYAPEQ